MANFFLACAAWLGIMILFGIGIYYAAVGSWWFLAVVTVAFIVAVYKIGCTEPGH